MEEWNWAEIINLIIHSVIICLGGYIITGLSCDWFSFIPRGVSVIIAPILMVGGFYWLLYGVLDYKRFID